MKRFSILHKTEQETNNSNENSNLKKLSDYFNQNKNTYATKNLPLLPKKKHSVFFNFQYAKGFPLEDQIISKQDVILEEQNHTLSYHSSTTQKNDNLNKKQNIDFKVKRNQKNNENDLVPIKEEQDFDFQRNNTKEDNFFKNQNCEKDEKKYKLEKVNLKKQNMLIELYNAVDLEGKYQKILFVVLALSAFICSMLITSYPLQKELPNFECLPADGFNANEFKKFQFKLMKSEECIVKYCFPNSDNVKTDNNNEVNSNVAKSAEKFLESEKKQGNNQDLLNQAKKTYLVVDYSSKKNFITILDIFCDVEYYNKIFTKVLFISRIIGILVFGYISDTYGRKFIFSNGLLIILISNLVFLFVKNIYIYILFAFLGNLSLNLIQLITITAVESMSKKYYSTLNGVFNSLFGISGLLSIFVMYKTQNWNYLLLIHIFFDVIVVALYYMFVVETPLYSLCTKNIGNFLTDIEYISKLNGVYEKIVKEKVDNFISFCKMYDKRSTSEKINLPQITINLVETKTNAQPINKIIDKIENKNPEENIDGELDQHIKYFLDDIFDNKCSKDKNEINKKDFIIYNSENETNKKNSEMEMSQVLYFRENKIKEENSKSNLILNKKEYCEIDENNKGIKQKFIQKNIANEQLKKPIRTNFKSSSSVKNTKKEKPNKAIEAETKAKAVVEAETKIQKAESFNINKTKRASIMNLTVEEKVAIEIKNNLAYCKNYNVSTDKKVKFKINKEDINNENPNNTSRFEENFILTLIDFKNYFNSIYAKYSKIFENAESRRTFFFFLFPYLSVMIGYYGQLMFVEKLPGNIFLNSFLIYFADIISPNIAGYVLRFVFRKKVLLMFHVLIIFICLVLPNLPVGAFYTVFLFTNSLFINCINIATDIFAAESFDSSIRSSAIGLLILSGFVSNVFADSLIDIFGTPFYLFALLSALSIPSIYNIKDHENYLEE